MTSSPSPHYDGLEELEELRKNSSLKTVSHDKSKVTISPLALNYNRGAAEHYWKIDKASGTIVVLHVSRLEVKGTVSGQDLRPGATYSVKFKVKMHADAFGWRGCPVFLTVQDGDLLRIRQDDLTQLRQDVVETIPDAHSPAYYTILPFTAPGQDQEVTFRLRENWTRTWKGGLEIIQVIIEKCDSHLPIWWNTNEME